MKLVFETKMCTHYTSHRNCFADFFIQAKSGSKTFFLFRQNDAQIHYFTSDKIRLKYINFLQTKSSVRE